MHGNDNKILKWPELRRKRHVKDLWKKAFIKALAVVKMINKTVELKEIKLKGGKDSDLLESDQQLIEQAGKVQRATPKKQSHDKIFGTIPN